LPDICQLTLKTPAGAPLVQLLASRFWHAWHWQTGHLVVKTAANHCSPPHASSPAGQLAAAGSGDGKLGYIRIATFSRQTEEKVRAALQTLKEQVSRGCWR
jgi:hypothetical protein